MSAGKITRGRRVYPEAKAEMSYFSKPGDYGRNQKGEWMVRLPSWTDEVLSKWFEESSVNPHSFAVRLGKHSIVEHDDGTITASPSVLWGDDYGIPGGGWHGFLEHGVWREI